MFEAILFDFDGTLVDFVASDIQSLKRVHSCTGTTVCSVRYCWRKIGRNENSAVEEGK